MKYSDQKRHNSLKLTFGMTSHYKFFLTSSTYCGGRGRMQYTVPLHPDDSVRARTEMRLYFMQLNCMAVNILHRNKFLL
jgi:hypothetical protein